MVRLFGVLAYDAGDASAEFETTSAADSTTTAQMDDSTARPAGAHAAPAGARSRGADRNASSVATDETKANAKN